MATEEFSISVSDPTKQGENVSSFILYKIATRTTRRDFPNNSYLVLRRFNDFTWLHEQLSIQVPGAIIPPLPQKVIVGRFSSEFIERRRKSLERFLIKVSRHNELSYASSFIIFLTANEQELADAKIQLRPKKETPSTAGLMQWFDVAFNSLSTNVQNIRSESKSDAELRFDMIASYATNLELQLQNVIKHTSTLVRKNKELASAFFEFGLAFTLLGQAESDGIGPVLTKTGHTADQLSILAQGHSDRETNDFEAPLVEFLGMVSAVKTALSKRQEKKFALQSARKDCESKKEQLAKYTQQNNPKLSQAAQALEIAEQNMQNCEREFQEISERVIREVEVFNENKVIELKELLLNYITLQISHHQAIEQTWENLLKDFENFSVGQKPFFGGNNQSQESTSSSYPPSNVSEPNDGPDLVGV